MAFISPIPVTSQIRRVNTTCPTTQPLSARSQPARIPCQRVFTAPRMLVVDAGSAEDIDKILSAADDTLVVVDYSTTWCGPCKSIAPVFEEMSERYTDVVFVKVMGDLTDDSKELMKREGIRAVPAFHFWKQKKRVRDTTGINSEDLEKLIVSLK